MGFIDFFGPGNKEYNDAVKIAKSDQTILIGDDTETLILLNGKKYRIRGKRNVTIRDDGIIVNNKRLSEEQLERYLIN